MRHDVVHAPIQPPLLRPISFGALVPCAGRDDPSRPRPVRSVELEGPLPLRIGERSGRGQRGGSRTHAPRPLLGGHCDLRSGAPCQRSRPLSRQPLRHWIRRPARPVDCGLRRRGHRPARRMGRDQHSRPAHRPGGGEQADSRRGRRGGFRLPRIGGGCPRARFDQTRNRRHLAPHLSRQPHRREVRDGARRPVVGGHGPRRARRAPQRPLLGQPRPLERVGSCPRLGPGAGTQALRRVVVDGHGDGRRRTGPGVARHRGRRMGRDGGMERQRLALWRNGRGALDFGDQQRPTTRPPGGVVL